MDGNKASPSEEEKVSFPIVFQCIKCCQIVGDSFAFVSSNPELETITLSATTNIKRTAEVYTSYKGHDIGCTYINFICIGCENPLGKFYLTTSKDNDNLREVFTFEIRNISSYELGKARHGRMPDAMPTATTGSLSNTSAELNSAIQETLHTLQNEIEKVQYVMCGLDNRVGNLEMTKMLEDASLPVVPDNRKAENKSLTQSQKRKLSKIG